MPRRLPDIRTLPQYKDFCLRYRHNLVRYAIEVAGIKPTYQQLDILEAMQKPGARVGVCSGHGTGKSTAYAIFIDWHMKVYILSNLIITANAIEQVRSVVWKELDGIMDGVNSRFPWLRPYFIKETKRYYYAYKKDSWWAMGRTASKSRPEALSGQHRKWYTVLVDEASAVDDEIHGVLRGALTNWQNRYIMCSQGTRASGHFYDAFHTLGEIYDTFRLNAETSPLVSREKIREWLIEYNGHANPEYQIKVLGNHPDNLSGYLIPRSWAQEAQGYRIEHDDNWGWIITADVAEGKHRDSSCWIVNKVSGYDTERKTEPVSFREFLDLGPKKFASELWQESLNYKNATIIVDSVGVGLGAAEHLEDLGANVIRLNWGVPCHAEKDRKRFRNQRAYANYQLRNGILEGRHKLIPGEKILDQASKLPYKINEQGQYVMASKEEMKEKYGLPSPDLADAHSFVYLCDYIPADSYEEDGGRDKYLDWAKEALGEAA